MRAGLPRTVSHSRMADHQALVAGSSEIAPPWKRATARLLASGIAAARGGSLAASETKGLQPGSCFDGDSLQIPCSRRRHGRRPSAIRGDVPAMRAQCPLWVISGSRTSLGSGPFYPRKRTNSRRGGRSASCQEATYAPQQTAPLNSSPITSRDGGTSRPSILAVWVLMTNSNFDACTTGRSNVQNIAQRKPPSMLDRMPIAFAIMGRRQPRVRMLACSPWANYCFAFRWRHSE